MTSTRLRRAAGAIATSLALITTLGSCATDTKGDSDTVVLKFADSFSATHPIGVNGAQPFLEYLQKHGPAVGLDIEYYAAGQLGRPQDMPALLQTGAIDIGAMVASYVSDQLPLSTVSDLPGLVTDVCAGARAITKLTQEGGVIYDEELEPAGIRSLWFAFVTDYEIMTTDRRVTTPDDVRGLMIRSSGGVTDRVVDQLGAAGVTLPSAELYEALQRGTVDGALFPAVSATSYRLDEPLRYSTHGAKLAQAPASYAISTEAWRELNTEQQAVVTKASTLANEMACKELPRAAVAATKDMESKGVELVPVDEATRAEWQKAMQPIHDSWVRDLESIGRPAGDVLSAFEAELERTRP